MKSKPKKYKTGIVLSGGAMRGFAHAGVLKALNEAGIFPDVISGSSAGSIVGALYADGYTPDEIFKIFVNRKLYSFLEFILPNKGLVKMTGLQKALKELLRAKTFEELKIPLYIAVTELNRGKAVYFSKGELPCIIIASSTIPILFQPLVINGITYVDGGVLNNLPHEPIKDDCEMLIGVNVNPVVEISDFDTMMKVADRTVHIMIKEMIHHKIPDFDLYIEPQDLHQYTMLNISKGKEMFNMGYLETQRLLKEKGL